MNFENQLGDGDFFTDLFNANEPIGRFEDGSEGSIFDEMVDAIMYEDKPLEEEILNQKLPEIEPLDKKIEMNDDKSEDEGLLFKFPIEIQEPAKEVIQEKPEVESKIFPVVEKEKIFVISTHNKKMVDKPKDDIKDAIKIQIPLEEDNMTELDQSETLQLSQKTKQQRRPRRDVTYKTILRKCRKYYQTQFNKTTGYLKQKKKEPCSFYKNWVLKYVKESFNFETHLDVSFHIGSLLYPQEMVRGIESFVYPDGVKNFTPKKVVKRKIEVHKEQVDKLHSILYKFTHEKLDKFITIPELAAIFLNFIQNGAGKDIESEEFKYEYEDLTKRCTKTLSKCKKVKGIATLFE